MPSGAKCSLEYVLRYGDKHIGSVTVSLYGRIKEVNKDGIISKRNSSLLRRSNNTQLGASIYFTYYPCSNHVEPILNQLAVGKMTSGQRH